MKGRNLTARWMSWWTSWCQLHLPSQLAVVCSQMTQVSYAHKDHMHIMPGWHYDLSWQTWLTFYWMSYYWDVKRLRSLQQYVENLDFLIFFISAFNFWGQEPPILPLKAEREGLCWSKKMVKRKKKMAAGDCMTKRSCSVPLLFNKLVSHLEKGEEWDYWSCWQS